MNGFVLVLLIFSSFCSTSHEVSIGSKMTKVTEITLITYGGGIPIGNTPFWERYTLICNKNEAMKSIILKYFENGEEKEKVKFLSENYKNYFKLWQKLVNQKVIELKSITPDHLESEELMASYKELRIGKRSFEIIIKANEGKNHIFLYDLEMIKDVSYVKIVRTILDYWGLDKNYYK